MFPVRAALAAAMLSAALAACAQPFPRQGSGAVADCDRLAADRFDPNRAAPGVMFDAIDAEAAVPACRAAVAQAPDEPRLHYQLGRALDKAEDYHAALAAYEAAGDYAPALTGVGYLYDEGLGVRQDFAKAVDSYRRAYDGGYALAASFLGYLYEYGRGVPQDYAQALRLYHEAAAKTGDPVTQNTLGYLYETGTGVPADFDEAVSWYRKAADQGLAYGQTNLGYMYETGQGVPQDDVEAVRLYRLAAAQGESLGQNNLAAMYAAGRGGLPQDHAEALRLYRLAAEQGEPLAMHNLGNVYQYGHGVPVDEAEAERWYRDALAAEDVGAPNALAWMLALQGRNLDEALALAEQAVAAEPGDPFVLDTLAWVHYRRGAYDAALTVQEQVVALAPDDAASRARLGDIYAALGRRSEARAAWQHALSLPDPEDPAGAAWDRAAVERKLAQG